MDEKHWSAGPSLPAERIMMTTLKLGKAGRQSLLVVVEQEGVVKGESLICYSQLLDKGAEALNWAYTRKNKWRGAGVACFDLEG